MACIRVLKWKVETETDQWRLQLLRETGLDRGRPEMARIVTRGRQSFRHCLLSLFGRTL